MIKLKLLAIVEKSELIQSTVPTLAPVAGYGWAELQGAVGYVGGSCKGCHLDFRSKKK